MSTHSTRSILTQAHAAVHLPAIDCGAAGCGSDSFLPLLASSALTCRGCQLAAPHQPSPPAPLSSTARQWLQPWFLPAGAHNSVANCTALYADCSYQCCWCSLFCTSACALCTCAVFLQVCVTVVCLCNYEINYENQSMLCLCTNAIYTCCLFVMNWRLPGW